MLKYRTIRMIKQKAAQGMTAYQIGQELGISKNTAARYMAEDAPAKPRYTRASKLEPFKPKIDALMERGIFNCVVILEHLQADGYDGGISILKEYVHPHRPPKASTAVRRYETESGRQAQTKGKVERLVQYVKDNFFPGRYFRDIEDLNRHALDWCRKIDTKPNGTTGQIPLRALAEEELRMLPEKAILDRYRFETRRVSREGLMERGGIAYPYPAAVNGPSPVEVRELFVYDRLIGGAAHG